MGLILVQAIHLTVGLTDDSSYGSLLNSENLCEAVRALIYTLSSALTVTIINAFDFSSIL